MAQHPAQVLQGRNVTFRQASVCFVNTGYFCCINVWRVTRNISFVRNNWLWVPQSRSQGRAEREPGQIPRLCHGSPPCSAPWRSPKRTRATEEPRQGHADTRVSSGTDRGWWFPGWGSHIGAHRGTARAFSARWVPRLGPPEPKTHPWARFSAGHGHSDCGRARPPRDETRMGRGHRRDTAADSGGNCHRRESAESARHRPGPAERKHSEPRSGQLRCGIMGSHRLFNRASARI